MASAVSVTGLTEAQVKRAKDAGCKAFRARGDVDCDMLLDWHADHPETVTAESEDIPNIVLETALRTRADRKTREFKLDELRRQFIPVDEMRRTFTRSTLAAKSKWLSSDNAVVAELRLEFSLGDEQVRRAVEILAKYRREPLKELAKCEWHGCKCEACGAEIK